MADRLTRQSAIVMIQPVTSARLTRQSVLVMVAPPRRGQVILTAPVGLLKATGRRPTRPRR